MVTVRAEKEKYVTSHGIIIRSGGCLSRTFHFACATIGRNFPASKVYSMQIGRTFNTSDPADIRKR